MNVSVFAGRIGGDPRLGSVNGQEGPISVLNFSLAVDKTKKDPTTGKPLTLWVDCALWGKRADALAPYIKKGGYVTVTGEADVELFQGNNGAGVKMTLRVSDLKLQGQAQQAAPADHQNAAPAQQQQGYQNQSRTGYNANGSAAPNNYAGAGPHGGFNQPQGQQQPPIDFSDEIPF